MEQLDLFQEEDKSLMTAFAWWEKRRLTYNLIVGLTGIALLLLLNIVPYMGVVDILFIVVYGAIANICYSIGFFIEIAARHYFKSKTDFTEKRKVLFGLGVLLSVLVTAAGVFLSGFIMTLQ